jgi:hypothetical protein
MKRRGMQGMPGWQRRVRGGIARLAVIVGCVLCMAVQTLTAAEQHGQRHADEAAVIFSGVAERQVVAPVPQPVWMAAAIMGLVIVVGMRRVRRGRDVGDMG